MDDADTQLPRVLESLLQNIIYILMTVAVIAYVLPYFLIPAAALCCLYIVVVRFYSPMQRQVKRLAHTARSPLVSQLQVTVDGLATVHAFAKEATFAATFARQLDLYLRVLLADVYANRWYALRLEFVTLGMTASVAGLIVGLSGTLDPELAGLALLYASTLTGLFEYTTRLSSEAEARFTSIERIIRHIQNVAPEENPDSRPSTVAFDWPQVRCCCGCECPLSSPCARQASDCPAPRLTPTASDFVLIRTLEGPD